MFTKFIKALRSTRAVSSTEYAILAVGIVVVVAGAAAQFGPQMTAAFTAIGTKISAATTGPT